MTTAARIGRMFRIDPVAVLDATRFEWLVRLASARVVQGDEEKAAEQSKRESNRRGGGGGASRRRTRR